MKLYSDTITRADLYAALPPDVGAEVRTIRNPRKRANGYVVSLEGLGDRHTRRKNSGNYGATSSEEARAATWDDHGVWMAALFAIDPAMIVAGYDGRDDFEQQTRQTRDYVREYHKPESQQAREHRAPWLEATS